VIKPGFTISGCGGGGGGCGLINVAELFEGCVGHVKLAEVVRRAGAGIVLVACARGRGGLRLHVRSSCFFF